MVKHVSCRIISIVSPSHCHPIINNVLCNTFFRTGSDDDHWHPLTHYTAQLMALAKNNNETNGEFLFGSLTKGFFSYNQGRQVIRAVSPAPSNHHRSQTASITNKYRHTLIHTTINYCETKGLQLTATCRICAVLRHCHLVRLRHKMNQNKNNVRAITMTFLRVMEFFRALQ